MQSHSDLETTSRLLTSRYGFINVYIWVSLPLVKSFSFKPFRTGTIFIRQNLTPVDVRF